jgi:hypothetical protein
MHTSTECVKNVIREKGHFFRFLPPYSTYLEGTEYFFNQWKNIVRRARPTNDGELLVAIASIHAHVTEEQCESYYMHIVHNCEDVLPGKIVVKVVVFFWNLPWSLLEIALKYYIIINPRS